MKLVLCCLLKTLIVPADSSLIWGKNIKLCLHGHDLIKNLVLSAITRFQRKTCEFTNHKYSKSLVNNKNYNYLF